MLGFAYLDHLALDGVRLLLGLLEISRAQTDTNYADQGVGPA